MKLTRKKCGNFVFNEEEKDTKGKRPRIIPYQADKDQLGRHLHYCDYPFHRGMIKKEGLPICIAKQCPHYKRIYLNLGTTETFQSLRPQRSPTGQQNTID